MRSYGRKSGEIQKITIASIPPADNRNFLLNHQMTILWHERYWCRADDLNGVRELAELVVNTGFSGPCQTGKCSFADTVYQRRRVELNLHRKKAKKRLEAAPQRRFVKVATNFN